MFVVASFYHFFDFPHYAEVRPALKKLLDEQGIKGSLLLASEGINGTLAGTRKAVDICLTYLKTIAGEFPHKESLSPRQPFRRAKVRLKKETISLGEPVSPGRSGHYVAPAEWNALIADPTVTLIDARNRYEVHLGTFEGAINPGTKNFKHLPDFVRAHLDPGEHRKIASFCTGGIRCEKFSSWLLDQGFREVYQLQGGILQYLEETPEAESRWQGECYVFDERVAVGHGLAPSQTATLCKACGHALTPGDRAHYLYKENRACPYCNGA